MGTNMVKRYHDYRILSPCFNFMNYIHKMIVHKLDDSMCWYHVNKAHVRSKWVRNKGEEKWHENKHRMNECVAKAAMYNNPQLSSHQLCLEIGIRPFPAGTRKTQSLCTWKPPLTGYYCVFHRPDPFTTATHVNWRSYEQPVAQWGTGSPSQ